MSFAESWVIKLIINIQNCCGCHACYSICPTNCISMKSDKLGFLYPVVDEDLCIHCGLCEKVCPVLVETADMDERPHSFGGHAMNRAIRSASSSGGAFHILAAKIISGGGVVVGAALTSDYRSTRHIMVESIEGLAFLHGSKYVQSKIGDIYKEVKRILITGRSVLFSGTPCQVEGLNLYLTKGKTDVDMDTSYPNLITVEIICHGTPSPRLYERYIDEMENKLGNRINGVFFRDEIGGVYLVMRIETEKGITYRKDQAEDMYYRMFLSDTCLRESCYQCPSRGLKKRADITLSDFWGAENVAPDLIDGRGLSLISVHTRKGSRLFAEVRKEMDGHEVDFNEAIKGNPTFYISHNRPKLRDSIENDIERYDMRKLTRKYAITGKDRAVFILKKLHMYELLRKVLRRGTHD